MYGGDRYQQQANYAQQSNYTTQHQYQPEGVGNPYPPVANPYGNQYSGFEAYNPPIPPGQPMPTSGYYPDPSVVSHNIIYGPQMAGQTYPYQPQGVVYPSVSNNVTSSNVVIGNPYVDGKSRPSKHHSSYSDIEKMGGMGGMGGGSNNWDGTILSGDVPISIRHGFIRKVYGILFIQLLITFGIALMFGFWDKAGDWIVDNSWLFITCTIALIVVLILLVCVPSVGRRSPLNLIMLMLFSALFGVIMGYLAVSVAMEAFLSAIGITAAVVFAVSIFACQTKWDFTGCGPFIMVSLLILIFFGILVGFMHNEVANIVYGSLGAALFSFFLVYDTQKIVGGSHRKYKYSVDDYIFAALSLYMDIINLFSYILLLMQNT